MTTSRRQLERTVGEMLNAPISGGVELAFEVALALYKSLDTPLARSLSEALVKRDFFTVFNATVDPTRYTCPDLFARDRQAADFLRKLDYDYGVDREGAAYQTFLQGEDQCRKFNQGNLDNSTEDLILSIRREVCKVLADDFSPTEWQLNCRFGPGAAAGFEGDSPYAKLSRTPTVTVEFEELGQALIKSCPAWLRSLTYGISSLKVNCVPGGSYAQVPKDAKTHRNIETQPLLNGFAQLGLGLMIRSRLKRIGIDLNSQSRNRKLARDAFAKSLSTIDLSNASDTISTRLVRMVLPADWLHSMELSRTRVIMIKGKAVKLERFSSMGNGFTFELETLIFASLVRAVAGRYGVNLHSGNFHVYGDDIIVPRQIFDEVCHALAQVGFTPNLKKSFKDGNFFESCGCDYFKGVDVRPLFLKEIPTDGATLITLANRIRSAAWRRNCGFGCDSRYRLAWVSVVRRIPAALRRHLIHDSGVAADYIDLPNMVPASREGGLNGLLTDKKGKGSYTFAYAIERNTELNWYPAIATALWSLEQRGQQRLTKSTNPLFSTAKRQLVFDFRKDVGKWSLCRVKFERTTREHLAWT